MKMTTMQNRPTSVSEAVLQVELSDVRVLGSRRRALMRARIASGLAGPAESARAMTALSAALIASSSLAPLTPIGVDGLSLRPLIQIQTLPPAATVLFSERVLR